MKEISARSIPLLISFSGIDGAGKSTQIAQLHSALEKAGLRVKLVTFWDDVASLKFLREEIGHKVFKGDKGVGAPAAPIQRRDKNVQSPMVTLVRMAMYVLDAFSLRRTVKKMRCKKANGGADVVIFDRFLYDELANLKPSGFFTRVYVRMLLHFTWKPDVPLVLDADPGAAFARKPEYPIDFLHANRKAYLDLARVAGMTVIPPAAIDQAHAAILGQVQQKTRPAHRRLRRRACL